ncbi:HNH endonuclease [Virgibacillus sp. AGTR]|uniref:HNH endonuclease n=1 Tax=Virgibacillus sp. AGTR TaxID=2812055 RepID=UPI001D16250F|nr:HNH endonuclease [Virgibacillus sp. AGTR]MCC2248845.1 HNH endonuclease [Virgibacillus sp. AGTR]
MNIKKRCNKVGCNNLINTTETYCEQHKNHNYKQYEKIRTSTDGGRTYKRFYDTKEWKSLRYQAMLRDGFICVCCGREAKIGDHIIPTKVSWDLRLDINNVQSLCFECHNKKTLEDKRKYGI